MTVSPAVIALSWLITYIVVGAVFAWATFKLWWPEPVATSYHGGGIGGPKVQFAALCFFLFWPVLWPFMLIGWIRKVVWG